MSESQRTLAAILLTDIVGFTTLAQNNETLALELLEANRQIQRPIFVKHGGREVKTMGDAFLVEFRSVLQATLCAIDIQSTLNDRKLEREEKLLVRIGIHLGDVVRREGDVFGDAVNIASRIEPLAEPGGICVSEQVYDQVKNKIAYPFSRLAPHELKNVKESIDVYKVILPWQEVLPQTSAVPSPAKHRIAVLPFTNISADPADEYFADGMTEEMISTLSNIQGLNVISRTSVLYYRNAAKRASEISLELNAGVLLEGSVRKSGNKVRITVQLIDAKEDQHLWSEKYDRELGDVFAVQGEIAQQVAKALQAELLSSAKERIKRGYTSSTEAHTAYLKGRYHMNRATNEELLRAIEYFDKATKEDPNYALAHAALSDCYTYLAGTVFVEREAFPKAKQYALRAIELDDDLAEGHTSLGIVALQHDWDWMESEREFRRAIELNPSYSTAHMWYGIYLALARRFKEGISEMRLAEGLDPLSPLIKLNLGVLYYNAKLYDEAKTKLIESRELEEGNELTYMLLGLVYLEESMFDEALTELNKAAALGEISYVLGALGYGQAISGKKKEALQTLAKLIHGDHKGVTYSTDIAIIHLGLGETDRAFEYLEKAFEERESWLVLTCRTPFYDAVASNPRYIDLMRRIGLPLEQRHKKSKDSW